MPVKLGVVFFATLFFQTGFLQASETPFYKSWLQEHSFAHPGISSSAAVAPAPKSMTFSQNDTGPDVADGEIAWGHHKTSASAVSMSATSAFTDGAGSDVPDSEIAWGHHKS